MLGSSPWTDGDTTAGARARSVDGPSACDAAIVAVEFGSTRHWALTCSGSMVRFFSNRVSVAMWVAGADVVGCHGDSKRADRNAAMQARR
ncbi:hypothetical protein CVT25_011771 [Psilocybe cyanescens]|uniref:Uncharacterized protein n=1 Tax=Psilocybe cyanescens TaxID=93625 RepID=A0A409VVB3_PSICY|nr:hypothetical protein CVT25_011771 [Psilocybe cyanescens]